MPTLRQTKALKNMVENGGTLGEAMIAAGYSVNTAKTPAKLTDSVGFRDQMDEWGLTDSLIVTSLKDDIVAKPGNRKGELELAAKLRGRLKEDPLEKSSAPVNLTVNFVSNQFARGV